MYIVGNRNYCCCLKLYKKYMLSYLACKFISVLLYFYAFSSTLSGNVWSFQISVFCICFLLYDVPGGQALRCFSSYHHISLLLATFMIIMLLSSQNCFIVLCCCLLGFYLGASYGAKSAKESSYLDMFCEKNQLRTQRVNYKTKNKNHTQIKYFAC